jgi:hypothetical protein
MPLLWYDKVQMRRAFIRNLIWIAVSILCFPIFIVLNIVHALIWDEYVWFKLFNEKGFFYTRNQYYDELKKRPVISYDGLRKMVYSWLSGRAKRVHSTVGHKS